MTKTELKQKVTELLNESYANITPSGLMHEDFCDDAWKDQNILLEDIKQVGGEGEGDTYYTVISFTCTEDNTQVLASFNGWYASYNGAEYQDWGFVVPKEVMRTIYVDDEE